MESFTAFFSDNTNFFSGLFVALLLGAALFVLAILLNRVIFPKILRNIDKEKHPVIRILLKGFQKPVNLFLKIFSLCVVLFLAGQNPLAGVPNYIATFIETLPAFATKIARVTLIVSVTWGLLGSNSVTELLLQKVRHKLDWKLSRSVIHFLTAVFNVIVVLSAVFSLLTEFNFDVYTLLAGLGIGGLTIALAAQDSASNFFGGLVLIIEKPFEIGDRIVCGDVTGTVEDINLRSTKVRTDDGSLTIVPNAKISSAAVTNWSGVMKQRRADITLNVKYSTGKEQLRSFISSIRNILETDPEIVSDSVMVRFSEFGDSSLNIRIVFYTSIPDYTGHMRVRERVNYAILDAAKEQNIQFAFPSTTVYLSGNTKNNL